MVLVNICIHPLMYGKLCREHLPLQREEEGHILAEGRGGTLILTDGRGRTLTLTERRGGTLTLIPSGKMR